MCVKNKQALYPCFMKNFVQATTQIFFNVGLFVKKCDQKMKGLGFKIPLIKRYERI